jgi:hypothetical protein
VGYSHGREEGLGNIFLRLHQCSLSHRMPTWRFCRQLRRTRNRCCGAAACSRRAEIPILEIMGSRLNSNFRICYNLTARPPKILAPATSALGAQFFIIQDSATNRCTITEQLPDLGPAVSSPPPTGWSPAASPDTTSPSPSTNSVLVGDGAYGDRVAAEIDMKAIAACAGNRQ